MLKSTTQQVSHHHVQPASMQMLVGIFGALLFLTFVTVAVAYVDLGDYNLIVAMLIATIKAFLVSFFFMHLNHDTGFNRLAFYGSFVFVLLFVSFTLIDTAQYNNTIDWQEKVLKTDTP